MLMLSWRKKHEVLTKAEAELNRARGLFNGSVELLDEIRKDLQPVLTRDTRFGLAGPDRGNASSSHDAKQP
jgi:hypothetical protein